MDLIIAPRLSDLISRDLLERFYWLRPFYKLDKLVYFSSRLAI